MADPFQDVDAAGADFIAAFADAMDARQDDAIMEAIVADYLGRATFGRESLTVEIGCGAGAVTRRIADHAAPAPVLGLEPSAGFVREAQARAGDRPNLRFEQADGTALPLDAETVDTAVLHTVLTHVTEPSALLAEAVRILKPGGTLIVCDSDFSKARLGSHPADPLEMCARAFVNEFVTNPFLVAELRGLLTMQGLDITHFALRARSVLDNAQMLPWVQETGRVMMERGQIGQELLDGLVAEYHRRMENGTLYGFQVFATAVARKPG